MNVGLNLHAAAHRSFSFLNRIRLDPDALEKVCQISVCTIRGINVIFGKDYLNKFITVLDIANMDDFYEIFQLPYVLFHPYNADRIDEHKLLNSFERILCSSWKVNYPDPAIRETAKNLLEAYLEYLSDRNLGFIDAQALKTDFQRWLDQEDSLAGKVKINLAQLEIILRPYRFLEKLTISTFSMVDVLCVPSFLQSWQVINLSHVSAFLGKSRCFYWLSYRSLDEYISLGLCLGFAIQCADAVRQLVKDKNRREENLWRLAASAAEVYFNWLLYKKANETRIILPMLITKTLGLIYIVKRKERQFFEGQ